MLSRVLARYARRQTPPACPPPDVHHSAPPPRPPASALPPVLRDLAALKASRPRVVRREIFAAMLVGYLRDEGFAGWHLPEDIDEVAAWLYQRHHIEPLPSQMMREAVAALPGVRHQRLRLLDRPELATIRIRLKARGQKVERAYLYHIAEDLPERLPERVSVIDAMPTTRAARRRPVADRPAAAAAPPEARPDRSRTRPPSGQTVVAPRKPRRRRTIADVRSDPAADTVPLQRVA